MGLFNQSVTPGSGNHLNVLHAVEHRNFTHGCTVAPHLVGMDDFWDVMFNKEPIKKRLDSLSTPVPLEVNIYDRPSFIDRPPSVPDSFYRAVWDGINRAMRRRPLQAV